MNVHVRVHPEKNELPEQFLPYKLECVHLSTSSHGEIQPPIQATASGIIGVPPTTDIILLSVRRLGKVGEKVVNKTPKAPKTAQQLSIN